jgi:hypothetical protein
MYLCVKNQSKSIPTYTCLPINTKLIGQVMVPPIDQGMAWRGTADGSLIEILSDNKDNKPNNQAQPSPVDVSKIGPDLKGLDLSGLIPIENSGVSSTKEHLVPLLTTYEHQMLWQKATESNYISKTQVVQRNFKALLTEQGYASQLRCDIIDEFFRIFQKDSMGKYHCFCSKFSTVCTTTDSKNHYHYTDLKRWTKSVSSAAGVKGNVFEIEILFVPLTQWTGCSLVPCRCVFKTK